MSSLKHGVSRTPLLLGTALSLAVHSPPALGTMVFGLTGRPASSTSAANQLVTFDTDAPATILDTKTITGLQVGETVLAIDIRPSTGQLYGLGSTSRLYVIETATGAATEVGSTSFVVPLVGSYFGFDFNPITERIRVVSDAGQNLRLDPDTGTVVDSDAGKPGVQPDASLPPGSSVVACAYTNNFVGAATTTLFGIDSVSDMLVRLGGPDGSPSPDLGDVAPIGALGGTLNVTSLAGLDVAAHDSDARAYAALQTSPQGPSKLYTIDLKVTPGSVTDLGMIGDGSPIRDIAVLSRPETIYAVTGANELIRFRSLRPDAILSTTPITGLQPGEQVVGIDARPKSGQLFGLGSTSRLYRIDTTTGVATQVGTQFAVLFDPMATAFGFDSNPVTDRIRVVSDTRQNFRLDPDTGAQIDSNPNLDGLQLDQLTNPTDRIVVASAFTNDLPGARSTTLFGIDTLSEVVLQGGVGGSPSPNKGLITPRDALGVSTSSMVGFDIAPVDGTAFASLTVGGTSGLYTVYLGTVDLGSTGAARALGAIGASSIRAIAVAPPGRFEFSAPTFTVPGNSDAATVTIIRLGGSNGPASVRFTASNGTATVGVDFEGVSTTVLFLDGETSKTVDVPLRDRALVDAPATVNLTLGAPSTSLGSTRTAVLTITGDGGTPPPPMCSVAAECDDHDRCTTDTCSGGACTNLLSPRFETVLCELDSARKASLCGEDPIKKKLVRAIRRLIVRTGLLVQRAAAGKKRAATRADTVLAAIQAKARKAAADVKISRPCGKMIDQRVQGIRDLLTAATP